jgi:hypothetical protein
MEKKNEAAPLKKKKKVSSSSSEVSMDVVHELAIVIDKSQMS